MSDPAPRQRRAAACVLAAVALLSAPAAAQVPEYALKAEFLERFTRFIEWPGNHDARAPFVIGLYRTNPFGDYLSSIASNRKIKGRAVEIRTVATPDDASRCDLLFIPGTERNAIPAIVAKTAQHPVLTVSEVEGAAEQGVLVNFYSAEENLRFEINDAAARKSGLEVSSRLLKLARVVAQEPRP